VVTFEIAASPETVLVEVQDYGVGLGNPDRVFEAFVTAKENGMGMGLTICRSIVEAHHGRLWAASGIAWHRMSRPQRRPDAFRQQIRISGRGSWLFPSD
jgi:signal transduction histidine kinase